MPLIQINQYQSQPIKSKLPRKIFASQDQCKIMKSRFWLRIFIEWFIHFSLAYFAASQTSHKNYYYNQIIQTLMILKNQSFQDSDSEQSFQGGSASKKYDISVLKYIPPPRKLLDGTNKIYELYSPRCTYVEDLHAIPRIVHPKAEQQKAQTSNRLATIQDAVFEHVKMKEKISQLFNQSTEKQSEQTLWDHFIEKEPYFSRFNFNPRKNNFASIYINIGGVHLEHKNRSSFPHIRSKTNLIKSSQGSLIFDSHFESGNLLCAFKNEHEKSNIEHYDLILQNDTNTKGHNQWFYFKVTNTKKNVKVRFNIVNLIKKESLFNYGLKPLVFSEKNYSKTGFGWVRGGNKVIYQENTFKRQSKDAHYYSLIFEYQFREINDTVYFAPSYPYTYTQMTNFLDSMLVEKRYEHYLSIKKGTESLGKNVVNVVNISTGKKPMADCKIIWILGRQHPVETTSSFMIEGIIKYILELLASRKEESIYDNYVFKIVPMVNPDGVIHGNARSELTGIDPNRAWNKTSKVITPTTHYLKRQILKNQDQIALVLDLHSHSTKIGCFFYGNHLGKDIKSSKLYPEFVCQNDLRFSYKNSRFRGGHESSARRALFSELNSSNIYTVECSLLGYLKNNRVIEYRISDYQQMGARMIESFFKLESMKSSKSLSQIIQEIPGELNDFCDALSARSQSNVSDEEYPEVYAFTKKTTLKKKKPTKEKQNTLIREIQTKKKDRSNTMVKTSKMPSCSNKLQKSTTQISETAKIRICKEKICKILNEESIEQNKEKIHESAKVSMKKLSIFRHNRNSNHIKLMSQNKRHMFTSIKQQYEFNEMSGIRSYREQEVQVQEAILAKGKTTFDIIEKPEEMIKKSNKLLMVEGNSMQDQTVFVGEKNEVGIQRVGTLKENIQVSKANLKRKIPFLLRQRQEDVTTEGNQPKVERSFIRISKEKKQVKPMAFRN